MSENNEKRKIHIEDFFTEEHEKEGIWFEPKIEGVPCGIQFLVTGTGTDENVANGERYDKAVAELEDIKDPVEKVKKRKVLDANRVAEFVKGVKAADDCDADFKGKAIEYSVPFVQELLLKAPLIQIEIIRFAKITENFIKREKND